MVTTTDGGAACCPAPPVAPLWLMAPQLGAPQPLLSVTNGLTRKQRTTLQELRHVLTADAGCSLQVVVAPHIWGDTIAGEGRPVNGSALVSEFTNSFGYLNTGRGYCRWAFCSGWKGVLYCMLKRRTLLCDSSSEHALAGNMHAMCGKAVLNVRLSSCSASTCLTWISSCAG